MTRSNDFEKSEGAQRQTFRFTGASAAERIRRDGPLTAHRGDLGGSGDREVRKQALEDGAQLLYFVEIHGASRIAGPVEVFGGPEGGPEREGGARLARVVEGRERLA